MKQKAAMTRFTRHETSASDGQMVVQVPLFADIPWLVHGFSTRQGGVSRFANSPSRSNHDLNLGKVPWDRERTVLKNRHRLLTHLHATEMKLVTLRQMHSDLIWA